MSTLIMPNIKPLIILQSTRLWTKRTTYLCRGASETPLYYWPLKLHCRGQIFAYECTATLRLQLSIIKRNGQRVLSYETT